MLGVFGMFMLGRNGLITLLNKDLIINNMKNQDKWKESKFVYNRKGKLIASRNPKEVRVSSRLGADLVANFYDRSLRKFAKGHLLDLGCGKVPLHNAYKQYISESTCIDWDNSFHKNIFLDMYCDLNTALPLYNNSYDTIILSDVLEHIKEPKALLKEINRIMTNDGILFINVPFFYWLHEEPHDYYRYTKYALLAMVEETGFEIIEFETLGGAPEILADILAKTTIRIPGIGKLLAINIQKLTAIFIKMKLGKKISKVTSNQFPFGYAIIAKKTPSITVKGSLIGSGQVS